MHLKQGLSPWLWMPLPCHGRENLRRLRKRRTEHRERQRMKEPAAYQHLDLYVQTSPQSMQVGGLGDTQGGSPPSSYLHALQHDRSHEYDPWCMGIPRESGDPSIQLLQLLGVCDDFVFLPRS